MSPHLSSKVLVVPNKVRQSYFFHHHVKHDLKVVGACYLPCGVFEEVGYTPDSDLLSDPP
jgi:hypothetical protein